ncbi:MULTISPECIES: alpha/beta fold hydrolase [Mycobacterium]|uniref:alpha/beta fold hydrolase n=1 Tax=Mycobacterium TaxID=1763 RepID=UPI0006945814|nr:MULTISPECIES: alpha/beta hydrolase [Mycobacterium]
MTTQLFEPAASARGRSVEAPAVVLPDPSLGATKTVITSDGITLSVRDHGSPDAAHTVVLLHGWCLNKEAWSIQIGALIRQWGNNIRIISYDHRGHGDSACAAMHTYRIERLAVDLAELLIALDVNGRLTLAGHSLGGMTALAYLAIAERPVEPQTLILIASAAGKLCERGLGRLLATPASRILYEVVQRAPRAAADDVIRVLARPMCTAATRYGGYGAAAREALVTLSAASINNTALTTKVGFLPALKTYDQYRTLGSITAKTIVISGGADRLTPLCHARDLAAGIPDAVLVYRPSAGHMLLHETPRLVTEAISRAIALGAQLHGVGEELWCRRLHDELAPTPLLSSRQSRALQGA